MHDEIKQIGELFRARRIEQKLSVKEVENATSIRSTYLEAIEEGRVYEFIASVYAAGFMKQYAAFLGFDADRMVKEHPNAFKGAPEKMEFDYGIGTLEYRGSLAGGVKWLPNAIWAGSAVALLILAWYVAKFLGVV